MSEFHDQQEATTRHVRSPAGVRQDGPSGSRRLEVASALGNAQVGRILHGSGVQRAGATSAQQLDESVARAIEDRRGRGQPLADTVRADMEGALGHDLSDVRVHTDTTAHELNDAVSARAFTAGSDVFFKQGTYDPASSSGRQLLAHELTHVVQQRTGTSGLGPGEVSDPSDAAEQHAEMVGETVASQPATPTAAPAPAAAGVARAAELEEEPEEAVATSLDPHAVARTPEEEEEEFQAGA